MPIRVAVRRITAMVRRQRTGPVNRKRVHRIIKLNGWQVSQKPQGKRPRVQALASRATTPNERWAIGTTYVFCGQEGWCPLTAIIDYCDRSIVA